MANRATGKGYENETFYANIKFQFWGIDNIHVMRASLQKLVEVCELQNPSMSTFLNGLESSGWMRHIKSIIDASVFVAKVIDSVIYSFTHQASPLNFIHCTAYSFASSFLWSRKCKPFIS